MSNNLGRDKVWTPEIWAEIDKAVMEEVGRIRVAQKVFPTSLMVGAQYVPDDEVDEAKMKITEGKTKPFIEISCGFNLSLAQVNNEATLHTGRSLARIAAKKVAKSEDEVFFQGDVGAPPSRLRVSGAPGARNGLLGLATPKTTSVSAKAAAKAGPYSIGEAILDAVNEGRKVLIGAAQPGPYALFLATNLFGEAYSPIGQSLTSAADRLDHQVTGGLHGTVALPDDLTGPTQESYGLLVSLGGEPVTLYVSQDATAAFTQQDESGDYQFRVFERVQFVARDRSALVALKITP